MGGEGRGRGRRVNTLMRDSGGVLDHQHVLQVWAPPAPPAASCQPRHTWTSATLEVAVCAEAIYMIKVIYMIMVTMQRSTNVCVGEISTEPEPERQHVRGRVGISPTVKLNGDQLHVCMYVSQSNVPSHDANTLLNL